MEESAQIKTLFPIYQILPFIILIEGFVSIAIEILIIRQLLPFAGGSVIVTSLIIGFFLLFLALGYHRGGRIVEHLPRVLRFNFLLASLWLGLGLSYFFILLFFLSTQEWLGDHLIYPLMIYLLLVVSPLIYILGQTIPIIMQLVRQNKSIGMIGGNVLGLSTLGSFLGATITALLLMQTIGVAWTIVFNALCLLILTLLLCQDKRSLITHSLIAVLIGGTVYFFNVKIEKTLFLLTNNYANYRITQKPSEPHILYINNSVSSLIHNQNQGAAYIELIKRILFHDKKLRDADILVLGAGGFTLSAASTFGNHFTYVDIDRQIKKVVVPQFLNHINGNLITDDARHFIRTTPHRYTAILLDAYTNTKSIPSYLLTREFMENLQRKLQPRGIILFNIVSNPTLADPYSKRVDNTIRGTFKNCMVEPLTYANIITNILYVCTDSTNQGDKTIYSDNLNTTTTDAFDW